MFALEELRETFRALQSDEAFQSEYATFLREFVGRPTPITCARNLTSKWGGADIYLKREDLCHTGSHKLNNALGQALLAKRIGKKRIIAETGAGQHGVATATACALLGLECVVYMGEEDVHRQALNVFRMRLLGAQVVTVHSGTRTLKDAINEAMRDWVTNVRETHYIVGSVVGPHPFPLIVREFQKVIGAETRQQFLNLKGKLPDCVMACVGGGSNAAGMFYEFIPDENVAIYGVEAGGLGLETGRHAAALGAGKPGVLHGAATYVMQNEDGQIVGTHSISAGLDYPAVGPEHSYWKDSGRVAYLSATDEEALQGFCELSEAEGIIPALEPAHVIPRAKELAAKMGKGKSILICLSGRGDKDVASVREALSRR